MIKKLFRILKQNNKHDIISSNLFSAVKIHKIRFNKKELQNSQKIEDKGFFIGLPTKLLNLIEIDKLTSYLLSIDNF